MLKKRQEQWKDITASEDGLKSFKEIFDDVFTKCLNGNRDKFFHKLKDTDVLCRVVDDKLPINRERFIPFDKSYAYNRWNPPGKSFLYLSFGEEEKEYSSELRLSEYICLEEYRAKKGNKYYFCNFKPVNEGVIFDLSYNDVSLRKIKNMLDEYEDTMASQMIEEIMKEPDAVKKYQNKKKLKKKVKKLQLKYQVDKGIIEESIASAYIKGLAEYVKNTIYEKANNVLLLSIIEAIGMNYQKEMPGYALELASSMELIYFDIYRSGEFISNPTKELLEKHIMLSMGVPEIIRRYEKDEKCACNLQQYFANSYLYGDDGIKNRCHVILDYLYSIYDEKTYSNENLQIQKMDFRDVAVTKIDEKTIMIEPQIKGEAQKIVKNNEDANEPILQLNKIINHLLEDINDKKANAGQVITVIDILCEKMKDDYRIEMQFEKVLVTFIASALIMCDITDEQRNKLVEEWIKRVKKIFSNQSYVAEVNMVIVLWEQLNKNINNDLKKQILIMILESIVNDEKSGLISQLAELTYYFLGKNRNYASRVFNTIIMLAEDEMNHQKFNAVYIKNHNDAEYEFIPNMVPKLRGVDYWIRENKGNEYQNKRSEIIQEYLYDGKGGDLSEFDISNYDIDLLCNIACCGLDTEDEEFAIVISSIVQCMIEIWHKNCKEMRAHEIIDTFQEHKVSSYFQRELNIIGRNPEAVYDILFKGTDFSIFTRDTLDFYEDVLSGFLVSYVDGFREKGKRDDIEKKIRILETYVNSIPEDYVRNILEKRLFLCKGRYSRWDVNKVKAEYSYKDKCFLNVQIEKYGSNHLNDVLYTVYLLNISELLPEILTSISSCFTKAIRNSKEQFAKEIIDSQVIVDMIILKSFIFYSDEIKKDEKLINAYEDILLALTEIRNEKAAVLLDEFRIH